MANPWLLKGIAELQCEDERSRDLAVESLGDLIQANTGLSTGELQEAVDALGELLRHEQSLVVLESILNSLAHAKGHPLAPRLPIETIRNRQGSFKDSAAEHARYILEED